MSTILDILPTADDLRSLQKSWVELKAEGRTRMSIENGDLKEKDLLGIPKKGT